MKKNLDIFKKDESGRIGQIWPKRRDEATDISLTVDMVNHIKNKIDLPKDQDIKPGRYSGWRSFPKIKTKKVIEIIAALAGK